MRTPMPQPPPVVVVAGASSGVGRASARAFGARGARVALLARGIDGLEAAAREVREAGGTAYVHPLDVGDAQAVEQAADAVERALGPIDVWVNSAVAIVHGPVAETSAEEIARVTQTTYLGFVHGTLSALRRMRPRDRGTIVQVNSALAHRGIPLLSSYCAAKHAVQGFSESLRVELLHDRSAVRVSIVELAGINTPLYDVMRTRMARRPRGFAPLYEPEVAAEGVLWAADHRPRVVRVGSSALGVVLANRLAPALLDRYLACFGYESQLLDEPLPSGRADNLLAPLPGDRGARGPLSGESRETSILLRARRSLRIARLR